MARRILARVLRVFSQPPGVVLRRIRKEIRIEVGRFREPRRAAGFAESRLLAATESKSLQDLWERLADAPYPVRLLTEDVPGNGKIDPHRAAVLALAQKAISRTVDLLGSGPVALGNPIDWQRDYISGERWDSSYGQRMDYLDLRRARDVKFPWELSRLHWVVPVAQAYFLTREERYAEAVRELLESWIEQNPYAYGVNWASTMEVALRIVSWSFLFRACGSSRSWSDPQFRLKFLRMLYLHGEFTERYLEESDVNGNHFTAGAAGLVFAGLFFVRGRDPRRWAERGWQCLSGELPLQVGDDGVDIEASTAYHRLVLELFLFPALYRLARGLEVSSAYRARVLDMARFVACVTRADGTVPLWGDADDGRLLPLGLQEVRDHRYLVDIAASELDDRELRREVEGPSFETLWVCGSGSWGRSEAPPPPRSASFPQAGAFVMRNATDHVFIDGGPVGFKGRGGHGHNDCLSFEAVLDGIPLVTDCGSYVYTRSAEERNRFRSTAYHNTPCVDREEINRFKSSTDLWRLHDDARPQVLSWSPGPTDVFCGSHSGYQRLAGRVTPVRSVALEHARHRLGVCDIIEGTGSHEIRTPLHFVPGLVITPAGEGRFLVSSKSRQFELHWVGPRWEARLEQGRWSPRYGIAEPIPVIAWTTSGELPARLAFAIAPLDSDPDTLRNWLCNHAAQHEKRVEERSPR